MSTFEQRALGPSQRATHTFVIGQPGTGKSRALESWIRQDILAGNGVGVIDPHGDLFHNLVYFLSRRPEAWERAVIIDPCSPKWVVGFNPLEAVQGLSQERLSLFLTDVVVKMWKVDAVSAPRMVWLLTNSFLALSALHLTLLDLPRFLLDREFREGLMPRLQHQEVKAYFQHEYPLSQGAVHQWATPVLNKIGGLVFDRDVRLMLGGGSRLNFRQVLDHKLILLVNLSKGILGEGTSSLIGAFIVAHIQKAALSRADVQKRQPYYLYLDEFQNYTTDNIKDVLSESRKYGLSLTLAHQYLEQLSSDMYSAVLNTSGTMVCFRVGYRDAQRLAKEIFPSADYQISPNGKLHLKTSLFFPFLSLEPEKDGRGWGRLAQALAGLPARQFWAKRRGTSQPVHQKTFEVPDPKMTPENNTLVGRLYDASGRQYGRLKVDARREYDRRYTYSHDDRRAVNPGLDKAKNEGFVPFWGQ